MPFRPEPAPVVAQASAAVLWCNLGSPAHATAAAVRPYLAEFLSDPRVVELPRALWKPLLHGVILRRRPAQSAAKYARIWTPEGSPLALWTRTQATLLKGYLGERGQRVRVRHAMRYGEPSIGSQLDALKAEGATRVLVLPAYPQYSGTTTASVIDAVAHWSRRVRRLPELRFVNQYHDDAGYIEALAHSVQRHWQAQGRGPMLLLSFHGIPERAVKLGDPYQQQCLETARLLAERLQLPTGQYRVCFQSRFGRARWIGPATDATLRELAAAGTARVDVLCPGFTGDCLETLEEIAIEGRAAFLAAGGKVFHYIPCLNDSPAWIDALAAIAKQHLAGWPTVGGAAGAVVAEGATQRR